MGVGRPKRSGAVAPGPTLIDAEILARVETWRKVQPEPVTLKTAFERLLDLGLKQTAGALIALGLFAAPAHGQSAQSWSHKFANWSAAMSFTPEAKMCLLDSLDTTHGVDAAFSVVGYDAQLRMTNMSGPHAKLANGKVEVRIDGQNVVTATGAMDADDVLAIKLTPSQFGDFLKKARLSHRMTIALGDGSTTDYVTDAGMVGAYMAMAQCLGAIAP